MGAHKSKRPASTSATPQIPSPDQVVASSDMSTPRKFAVPSRLRKPALVVLGVALVAVVGGIVFALLHKEPEPSLAGTVCRDTITREANFQNKQSNLTTFELLAKQVEARRNYAKDSDCLYILTEYQITAGNLDAAQTTMRKLRALYDPKHPFSKNLDDGRASLDNLQKQFDLMERAQDNANGSIDPAI